MAPSLDAVYDAIAADPFWDHLRLPGIRLVRGFGATRPKVLIVGEAPGATENTRGRPFCGPSGRVLDQLMEVAGLALEDRPGCENICHPPQGCCGGPFKEDLQANAYVTNVVKYRPPGNRTPSLAEILHAREGYRPPRARGPLFTDGDGQEPSMVVPEDPGPDLRPGDGSLRQEWAALGGPRVIIAVGGTAHSAVSPVNWEGVTRWAGQPLPVKGRDGYWIISQLHPAYGLRPSARQTAIQDRMERDWEALGEFLHKEGIR